MNMPDRGARSDVRRRPSDLLIADMAFTGEHLLRDLAPQVLGAIVRRFGDFAAAEDAVQEALHRGDDAVAGGGRAGQPARLADPGRRPAHDRPAPRRARAAASREAVVVHAGAAVGRTGRARVRTADDGAEQDDTLILLFMCCHPALTPSVGDRADAARRRRPDHGRDRQRVPGPRSDDGAADQPREAAIKTSGVPFGCRPAEERAERLAAVLHVLYLIFNEGYTSSIGADAAAQRPVDRGDPADAGGAPPAARTTARSRACWR